MSIINNNIYFLISKQFRSREIDKLAYFVTTNQEIAQQKLNEQIAIGNSIFEIEGRYIDQLSFPLEVNGYSIPEDNYDCFFNPFVLSTELNKEILAKEFSLSLFKEFVLGREVVSIPILPNEVLNHSFIIGLLSNFANEVYNYGDSQYKAIFPVQHTKLINYINSQFQYSKIVSLLEEIGYYSQFFINLVYKYEYKRLTTDPNISYTEFLNDPQVQQEIAAEFAIDPQKIPILVQLAQQP